MEPYSGRRTAISAYVLEFTVFQAREKYYEKQLLPSSYLSLRVSLRPSARANVRPSARLSD